MFTRKAYCDALLAPEVMVLVPSRSLKTVSLGEVLWITLLMEAS